MTWILIAVVTIFVGNALIQAIFAAVVIRLLRTATPTTITNDQLPKACILLPLRGSDPELAEGVKRLLRQDYPNYELHVVVDNAQDPALQISQRAVEELKASNARVTVLQNKLDTCSPQCSALVQAVNDLDESCEVVVIVDGDVVVHPNWLRELVAPLADPKVGVCHGNRWFMPRNTQLGSLVRYLWNAGAVVTMYVFHNPWAGTFAIRRKVLIESGLSSKWPRTIVPDALAKDLLAKMGLCVRFVPLLMMVNRERCSLWFAHDFFKRQMTWTRTYDPNWWPVLAQAVAVTALMLATVAGIVYAAVIGDVELLLITSGGFLAYIVVMAGLLLGLEWAVRKVLRDRNETTTRLALLALLKLPLAIPLTQLVHTSAALLATFRKRVIWRGVTYEIRGPFDVRVVRDQPLLEAIPTGTDTSV